MAYTIAAIGAGGTTTATATITVNPSGRKAPSGAWQLTGPNGGSVTVFAIDPNAPNVVYASSSLGGNGGMWKSTDSGTTWKPLVTNTPIDFGPVADIYVNGNTIYVALSGFWFFKSTDGGNTWNQSTVIQSQRIGAMTVDTTNISTVYLSLPGAGVAKSTNSGSTWHPFGFAHCICHLCYRYPPQSIGFRSTVGNRLLWYRSWPLLLIGWWNDLGTRNWLCKW